MSGYVVIEALICAVPCLAEMEFWGVGFDVELCKKSSELLARKLESLATLAHQLAKHEFNLRSQEVGMVLFEELLLPAG